VHRDRFERLKIRASGSGIAYFLDSVKDALEKSYKAVNFRYRYMTTLKRMSSPDVVAVATLPSADLSRNHNLMCGCVENRINKKE